MKCRIERWLKIDGAFVRRGEIICILNSGTTDQEIEATEAGILRHLKKEGALISDATDEFVRIELPGKRGRGR